MIALWMLHAVALAALLALAAALAERALRVLGRPARGVWAAALALAVVLPAVRLLPRAAAVRPAAAAGGLTLDLVAPAGGAPDVAPAAGPLDALVGTLSALDTVAAPAAWRALDVPLAAAWALATLLLAARLLVTARRTAARVRTWPAARVGGVHVRVAPDLGPAVFGARRATVIVPRWAMRHRRLPLMLAHETAHLRARDPQLLAAALAAAVLVPWNAAAWWALRRLRLAVELDCDARVLAGVGGCPDVVRRYGALLLDVARRAAAVRPAPALLAPTLLATPSTLARRIHAMTAPRPRRAPARALAAGAVAVLLVAVACEMPRPTGPRPQPNAPLARVTEATRDTATATSADRAVAIAEMRRVLEQAFPEALREAQGRAQQLWFVQEADGRVSRVMRGTPTRDRTLELRDATMAREENGIYVRGAYVAGADTDSIVGVPADRIATIEVLKLAPGALLPDSVGAIWIRLKAAGTTAAAARDAARAQPRPSGERVMIRRAAPSGARIALTPDTAGPPGATAHSIVTRAFVDSSRPRPLIVIDGVLQLDSNPRLPKPDSILSVDVIKGAAAEARYGPQARAGGVISIETKKP